MHSLAIFVDGGSKLGYGNYSRVSQLATYIRSNNLAKVVFVVCDMDLKNTTENDGFRVIFFETDTVTNLRDELEVLKKEKINKVLIDVRNDYDISGLVGSVREYSNATIASVGTVGDSRKETDISLYPMPRELTDDFDWSRSSTKIFAGLKYLPVRKEFFDAKSISKTTDDITISIGASDPHDITSKLMDFLSNRSEKINVILGPGFTHEKEVEKISKKYPDRYKIIKNPKNFARTIAPSAVVFTGAGISVYELLVYDMPMATIGHYPLNSKVQERLDNLGYCRYLGLYNEFKKEDVDRFMETYDGLSSNNIEKPDEQGIRRAAEAILS